MGSRPSMIHSALEELVLIPASARWCPQGGLAGAIPSPMSDPTPPQEPRSQTDGGPERLAAVAAAETVIIVA